MANFLLSKKSLDKMGKTINESQGSAVSSFARRQMEKMGWQEGKGLGKNEDGMASHIKQKKKEDLAGLGADKTTEFVVDSTLKGGAKTSITGGNDNWWHDAFASKLASLGAKDKKKRHKRDREGKSEKSLAPPTMEELFAATGGARLGMRARADQTGKFARSEKEVNTGIKSSVGLTESGENESKIGDKSESGSEKEDKMAKKRKKEMKKEMKKEKRAKKDQREE